MGIDASYGKESHPSRCDERLVRQNGHCGIAERWPTEAEAEAKERVGGWLRKQEEEKQRRRSERIDEPREDPQASDWPTLQHEDQGDCAEENRDGEGDEEKRESQAGTAQWLEKEQRPTHRENRKSSSKAWDHEVSRVRLTLGVSRDRRAQWR
jgi:hypothetical protein